MGFRNGQGAGAARCGGMGLDIMFSQQNKKRPLRHVVTVVAQGPLLLGRMGLVILLAMLS